MQLPSEPVLLISAICCEIPLLENQTQLFVAYIEIQFNNLFCFTELILSEIGNVFKSICGFISRIYLNTKPMTRSLLVKASKLLLYSNKRPRHTQKTSFIAVGCYFLRFSASRKLYAT